MKTKSNLFFGVIAAVVVPCWSLLTMQIASHLSGNDGLVNTVSPICGMSIGLAVTLILEHCAMAAYDRRHRARATGLN